MRVLLTEVGRPGAVPHAFCPVSKGVVSATRSESLQL
jgi:hypothetical protein